MNDEALTALLYADSDNAPPTQIDLQTVMAVGRRRRRLRRVVLPALALVAVAGLVGGVTVAVDRVVTPSPTTVAALADGPKTLPLDRVLVHLGWIPEHGPFLKRTQVSTTAQAIEVGGYSAAGHAYNDVTIFAAGVVPWQLVAPGNFHAVPKTAPAPSVNGHRALWYLVDGKPTELAWEWAKGSWAVLSRVGNHDANAKKTLSMVAAGVRIDHGTAALCPNAVTLPPTLRLVSYFPADPADPHPACSIELTLGDPSTEPYPTNPRLGDIGIQTLWTGSGVDPSQTYNRTVGGHRAWFGRDKYGFGIELFDVDGYWIYVNVRAQSNGRFTEADADALALAVTTNAAPDDPAQWTDHPVRQR